MALGNRIYGPQFIWVRLLILIHFSQHFLSSVYFLELIFLLIYLGGYDKEEKAARSYDLAALKYWGTTTTTNFPVSPHACYL